MSFSLASPYAATGAACRNFDIHEVKARVFGRRDGAGPEVCVGEAILRNAVECAADGRGKQAVASDSLADKYGSVVFELCRGRELLSALRHAYGAAMAASISDILAIERINILPPHRGRGIGSGVINALLKRARLSCRVVVLRPFPLDWHEIFFENSETGRRKEDRWMEQGTARLRRFYERFGFRPVTEQWMARPADDGLRQLAAAELEPHRNTALQ